MEEQECLRRFLALATLIASPGLYFYNFSFWVAQTIPKLWPYCISSNIFLFFSSKKANYMFIVVSLELNMEQQTGSK